MKTSKSLLQRAKDDPKSDAWFVLSSIYDPLISGWIARVGVDESDVGDVSQEVLQTVAQELGKFEHNGRIGAFLNWLKKITINRCRRYWDNKKKQVPTLNSQNSEMGFKVLQELQDPKSDATTLWETEHDNYIFKKIVGLVQKEFEPEIFDVFYRNTINNEPPKSISEELDISVGQVYKMKFRVMQRLKEIAAGLIDGVMFDDE